MFVDALLATWHRLPGRPVRRRSARPREVRRLYPRVEDVDVESIYDDVRPPHDRRPYVLVNMVLSADGAIAVAGRTKEMSSPADELVFHLLRSLPDVILAGAQTVRTEHYGPPRVNDERQARRVARGQAPQPTIAVVTRRSSSTCRRRCSPSRGRL